MSLIHTIPKIGQMVTSSIVWHTTKPTNPMVGDCVMDSITGKDWIWTGLSWIEFTGSSLANPIDLLVPTPEQLEKYPALKEAWEEYVIVRKLIGR